MTRTARWTAIVVIAALALFAPAAAYAAPFSGTIPGTPLGTTTFPVFMDATTSPRAVFNVQLVRGETLVLSLATGAGATADFDLDMYLYAPGTAAVNHAAAVASANLPLHYPETITYTAPASGQYYLEVFADRGSGPAALTWSVVPEPLLPVYRFYNVRTGTHFYTPSADEAANVRAWWPTVFRDEGAAYYTKASRNDTPLYRFYNRRNGSHFYTASEAEKNTVIALWSGVFTFEGPTYAVSMADDGTKTPVYRFFNVRNGSHFFTASQTERDMVAAQWGNVYRYEGTAFWVGQ